MKSPWFVPWSRYEYGWRPVRWQGVLCLVAVPVSQFLAVRFLGGILAAVAFALITLAFVCVVILKQGDDAPPVDAQD